jgi:hypothetical protein
VLLLIGIGACAPQTSNDLCVANDECAADQVCAGGICQAKAKEENGNGGPTPDGGQASSSDDAGPGDPLNPDDPSSPPPNDAGPGASGACLPNGDGTITADELPLFFDLGVNFIASGSEDEPVPVDVAGELQDDGSFTWQFDSSHQSDRNVILQLQLPQTNWAFEEFPTAEYVAPLDADETLWGFYRRQDDGLFLLGLASAEPERTRISYDPPVLSLPFPLTAGFTHTQELSAEGVFEYNPFFTSSDTYQLDVDGEGRAHTPSATYPVLRVRIRQTIRAPIAVWPFILEEKQVVAAFVSECLGAVVQARSPAGVEGPDFSEAASLLRLGMLP